eukprot:COSAG06_NODE_3358_length_5458_cov_7.822542_3_plen_236_part_00
MHSVSAPVSAATAAPPTCTLKLSLGSGSACACATATGVSAHASPGAPAPVTSSLAFSCPRTFGFFDGRSTVWWSSRSAAAMQAGDAGPPSPSSGGISIKCTSTIDGSVCGSRFSTSPDHPEARNSDTRRQISSREQQHVAGTSNVSAFRRSVDFRGASTYDGQTLKLSTCPTGIGRAVQDRLSAALLTLSFASTLLVSVSPSSENDHAIAHRVVLPCNDDSILVVAIWSMLTGPI